MDAAVINVFYADGHSNEPPVFIISRIPNRTPYRNASISAIEFISLMLSSYVSNTVCISGVSVSESRSRFCPMSLSSFFVIAVVFHNGVVRADVTVFSIQS